MKRLIIVGFVAVLLIGTAALSIRLGQSWGRILQLTELSYSGSLAESPFARLSRFDKAAVAWWHARQEWHAAYAQDRWVSSVVYPGQRDGYYVDVGAGDAFRQSNTAALDTRGWRGLAIDPFPSNFDGRPNATVVREVVYSRAGETLLFRASDFAGGLDALLNHSKGWDVHKTAEGIEVTTTTLTAILEQHQAPRMIHYLSLDIEGGELEALKGLDFSTYSIGAITVEHNWEEPKRSEIRALLEAKGFRNVMALVRDDFYVHTSLGGVARPD